MAALPESPHTTPAAIIRWYESKPQEHRPHMGASLIGHSCDRYIWLTWRWALKAKFGGRMLRLFNTGQREENRLVEELRGIGATVWDIDPDSGDQWRVSACGGHFGGSLDGVAKGLPEAPKSPAVLEFKTHSDKSFNDLLKKKVQGAKPQHYAQMTVYMGLMSIDRALYLAVNKNTDDVYAEWIHFDKEHFDVLINRAQRLIDSSAPPERLSNDPAYFECKYCNMYTLCHGQQAAEANCRTCCHSTPEDNAAWVCNKGTPAAISDAKQRTGCDYHLMIPALVPFGEPTDGGENWVAYKHRTTGDYFINGPDNIKEYGPNFSSRELHNCNGTLIAEVIAVKTEFPVSKVTAGETQPAFNLATAFDDLATDPDELMAKPAPQAKRTEVKKIRAAVAALEDMKK